MRPLVKLRPRAAPPRRLLPDRKAEHRLLADAIASVPTAASPLRLLEAGCGQRWPLQVNGVKLCITGIDNDADAMRIRQDKHGDLDDAIVGDLRTVQLDADQFDVAYCSFVLEHVAGARDVLDRLVHATKPGGRIIIRVPDGDTVFGFVVKHTPHWVHVAYKRYVEGFPNAGKPGHAPYPVVYDQVISLRGLRDYARNNGLTIADEYGTDFDVDNFGRLRWLAKGVMGVLALLSAFRIRATHSTIGLVLERPADASSS